jgi:hypothetical protein
MAIRLRSVAGIRVALCAAETDPMPVDVYLDDTDHGALSAKFALDWLGQIVNWGYPMEWSAMATQKVRLAENETRRANLADIRPDESQPDPFSSSSLANVVGDGAGKGTSGG